jgi:hypothetical protein
LAVTQTGALEVASASIVIQPKRPVAGSHGRFVALADDQNEAGRMFVARELKTLPRSSARAQRREFRQEFVFESGEMHVRSS